MLPSGQFDVPLALQDKRFASDGSLVYDREEEDGFLGDKFLVNGMVQPFFRVKRRKYRFRVLNASNARWYRIYLTDASGQTFPFDQIGTDGGLLAAPIRDIRSFQISLAERAEIVIDFSRFPTNQILYLENRLEQDDGRGPDDVLSRGPRLLKFIVGEPVPDTSQVPPVLRPCDPISEAELSQATRRTFEFERSNSSWVINGEPVHINHPVARPVENKGEIWRLINGSGGWTHPIHLHLDFMRVLRRNGRLPPPNERDGMAKKDTIALGENETAEVFIKYRDYPGRYVFHCHNLEHEDHAMMAVFDVMPAPVATSG
jgi:FtsP/CotA-like multicopper oxidase with cupredoxin domain